MSERFFVRQCINIVFEPPQEKCYVREEKKNRELVIQWQAEK